MARGGRREYPDGRPQGRPPGALNKRTQNQLLDAKRAVAEARAQGRKLAKEVADDLMHIWANMAMEVRPITKRELERGVPPNPKGDEAKFKALSAILLGWVTVLLPYQSARMAQIRLDVGEIADSDNEDVNALATLERLLDAYAAADEEERRLRAARDEEERRFRDARPVQDTRVSSEPEPSAESVVAPPDNVVPLPVPARPKTATELYYEHVNETYGGPPGSGEREW
jgi:hypothetical protein